MTLARAVVAGNSRSAVVRDGFESDCGADVMGREEFLNVRIAVLAEAQRLAAAFPPGRVGRTAGLQSQFVGAGAQFAAKERMLVEAAGQNLFKIRYLAEAPSLIVLLGDPITAV